jgi:hypothetical protein
MAVPIFQYRARAKQLISFRNLIFDTITPTDSDMEIEYKNKAWIFGEIKYKNKDVDFGQRLAFKRKVDDVVRGGKKAVLIVAEHDVEDAEMDVDAAACDVREIYVAKPTDGGIEGKWYKVSDGTMPKGTVREYVERFLEWVK